MEKIWLVKDRDSDQAQMYMCSTEEEANLKAQQLVDKYPSSCYLVFELKAAYKGEITTIVLPIEIRS